MKEVWILDNGCGGYEAFESLEDARERAELYLLRWYRWKKISGQELLEHLEELARSYNGLIGGFVVDELFWCWKIPYYPKEKKNEH